MRKRLLAALLTIGMLLSLIPASVFSATPGEGDIPIPPIYLIGSTGQSTVNPTGLEPGRIWTNKNVIDKGNGTFEIKIYAWGKEYVEDGVTKKPLVPGYTTIEITDSIGEMFDYNEDVVYNVGTFSVTDKIAKWIVDQDDILDGLKELSFTVSLKSGWTVAGSPYYTNGGAAAAFKPQRGNPYYWTKEETTTVTLSISGIKWNNGWDHGIQLVTIEDKDLDIKLVIEEKNKDPRMYVSGSVNRTFTYDAGRSTATFPTSAYTPIGSFTPPANLMTAANGTWGVLRTKGTAINGLYYYFFWFMGLEGPGVLTVYTVTTDNPGGNNGNISNLRFSKSTEYFKRKDRNWDGDIIRDPLPNKGRVSLAYNPYDPFGSIKIYKKFQTATGYADASSGQFSFDLFKLDAAGEKITPAVGTYATDGDGAVVINDLAPGKYLLVEKPKDGWILLNYKGGVSFEIVDLEDGYGHTETVWDSDDAFGLDRPVVLNSELGSLKVTAVIEKEHIKESWQKYYERAVQKFYEREMQKFYERDVHNLYTRDMYKLYERDMQNFYEREMQKIYERTAQKFYVRDVQDFYNRSVQDFYERDVQDYYVRTVQDFYTRDVQDFYLLSKNDYYYERDVQDFYERDVRDFYERDVQDFYSRDVVKEYVPTFTKVAKKLPSEPITSDQHFDMWFDQFGILAYGANTTASGNYYVALDLDRYRSVTLGFGSSYQDAATNSKKLTFTKDGNKWEKVQIIADAKHAAHTGNGKNFNYGWLSRCWFPNPNVKGAVHIYLLGYDDGPDSYIFTGWRLRDTRTGDYEFIRTDEGEYSLANTLVGNYALVKTKEGEYELVETDIGEYIFVERKEGAYELDKTETGEYEYVKTKTGQYKLVNTEFGDYKLVKTKKGEFEYIDTIFGEFEYKRTDAGEFMLVDTVEGDFKFVKNVEGDFKLDSTVEGPFRLIRTEEGDFVLDETVYGRFKKVDYKMMDSETVADAYDVDFTLTVTGPDGYNETFTLANKDEIVIPDLKAGSYTVVLGGDDIADQAKNIAIVAGAQSTVDFNDVPKVIGDVEKIELDPVKSDVYLDDQFADVWLDDQFADKWLDDEFADVWLDDQFADKWLEDQFADVWVDDHYADVWIDDHFADNYLEDKFCDYKLKDVKTNNKLDDVKKDKILESVYSDNVLEPVYDDVEQEDIYSDKKLDDVKTDNRLPDDFADNKLPDDKADNYLPDIYLGNDYDPFHPDAVIL